MLWVAMSLFWTRSAESEELALIRDRLLDPRNLKTLKDGPGRRWGRKVAIFMISRVSSLSTKQRVLITCQNQQPITWPIFFSLKINLFIYLFLAALGLRCCMRAFSSCGEEGLLFVLVCGLFIVVASLVVEHGL